MILDVLENAERYFGAHPALAGAFAFLRRPDLAALPVGRIELEDDKLFALIQRPDGRGRVGARLEAHRKYADIQFLISGHEEYGWRSLSDMPQPDGDFDEQKDLGFYQGTPTVWLPAAPRSFAIFFPEDLHAPLAGTGTLHKVVIKVRV